MSFLLNQIEGNTFKGKGNDAKCFDFLHGLGYLLGYSN